MNLNKKIYIAGHRGMVGSAIVRRLRASGYGNLVLRPRQELDLLDQQAVFSFLQVEKPDCIFLAAARVGGIHANNTYRGQFIYENLTIQNHVIHGAYLAGIKDLCFLGSSCIYPRDCPQPIKEEYLLTGPLEQTNEPYAIAKIAGIKLCEAYNRQYGTRYFSIMPTNLYGPNDNYDLETSHVLPAMIRKFHLAKLAMAVDVAGIRKDEAIHGEIPEDVLGALGCTRINDGQIAQHSALGTQYSVPIWGTGAPRREFLYVDDMADACVFLMEQGIGDGIYNIGTGTDLTIRELAETVMEIVGFKGNIVFDSTKPGGTSRKLLDVSRMTQLGWQASTPLREGIAKAYANYLKSGKC